MNIDREQLDRRVQRQLDGEPAENPPDDRLEAELRPYRTIVSTYRRMDIEGPGPEFRNQILSTLRKEKRERIPISKEPRYALGYAFAAILLITISIGLWLQPAARLETGKALSGIGLEVKRWARSQSVELWEITSTLLVAPIQALNSPWTQRLPSLEVLVIVLGALIGLWATLSAYFLREMKSNIKPMWEV